MSILIKGMQMPKNCDECRIMTYEDTNCMSVHELFCGCPIVFKAHPQHEECRPDYCPLEDADGTEEYIANLQETIKELVEELEKKDAAPTIIESEE